MSGAFNGIFKQTAEALKAMERTSSLSADEKLSLQAVKLKELLGGCFEYVEAYRPYRLMRNKAKDAPFDVLNSLPPITGEAYRKNPNVYHNPNIKQLARSGVRTKAGYSYPVSAGAWAANQAALIRAYAQISLQYRARHMEIRGRLPEKLNTETLYALKLKAENTNELFSGFIDTSMLARYSAMLGDQRLVYCSGAPSVMSGLALLFERDGISPAAYYKGIVTSGETLTDDEREIIKRVLGAPVYSAYITHDDGLIACECSHGSMHVVEDNFYVETINGAIAITNLQNSAAPRVRYLTGDTGELTDDTCPCGCHGKRLVRLNGKKRPLYRTPGGRVIPGGVFDMAAGKYYNILRYTLNQPEPNRAELSVILRTTAAQDEAEAFHQRVCGLMQGVSVAFKFSRDV